MKRQLNNQINDALLLIGFLNPFFINFGIEIKADSILHLIISCHTFLHTLQCVYFRFFFLIPLIFYGASTINFISGFLSLCLNTWLFLFDKCRVSRSSQVKPTYTVPSLNITL